MSKKTPDLKFDIAAFANKELLKEHSNLLKSIKAKDKEIERLTSLLNNNIEKKEAINDILEDILDILKGCVGDCSLDISSYSLISKKTSNLEKLTIKDFIDIASELDDIPISFEIKEVINELNHLRNNLNKTLKRLEMYKNE